MTKEWRVPDVCGEYNEKGFVFDFQLYTTFINTIIDRNSFYRLVNKYVMWLFPYFTTQHQMMCEKDTYYTHRRNVFVFDSEDFYSKKEGDGKPTLPFPKDSYRFAIEESLRLKKFMINCYWQEPYVKDGKLCFIWHHKLISFDELSYDNLTNDIFYIDSDRLFYDASDNETKAIIDHWKDAKEKRWNKIFTDLKCRQYKVRSAEELAEILKFEEERKENQEILEKIRSGIIELKPYYDESEKMWGFGYENKAFIPATFYSVKDFCGDAAPVKKNSTGHWGAINRYGKKTIPYQYDSIEALSPNCFVVSQNKHYGCINNYGEIILPLKYAKAEPLGKDKLLVNTGYWTYEKYMSNGWYDGNWSLKNSNVAIINLKGEVIQAQVKSSVANRG